MVNSVYVKARKTNVKIETGKVDWTSIEYVIFWNSFFCHFFQYKSERKRGKKKTEEKET